LRRKKLTAGAFLFITFITGPPPPLVLASPSVGVEVVVVVVVEGTKVVMGAV
jgi:hypothetical protein